MANGDILGFLDPDDALTPNALEIMVNAHTKHPEVGHIYSNIIYCDKNLKPIKVKKNSSVENGNPMYFILDHAINHFSTFKKEIYLKTEGIDPFLKCAEDMDLYFKLYEKSNVLYIEEDLYIYRIHKGGISTFDNENKAHFWHWVAIIKAAERRNVNIENLFYDYFYRKRDVEHYIKAIQLLKKSRIIKLIQSLGFLRWLKKI